GGRLGSGGYAGCHQLLRLQGFQWRQVPHQDFADAGWFRGLGCHHQQRSAQRGRRPCRPRAGAIGVHFPGKSGNHEDGRWSLVPDMQAKSPKPATIEGVTDKWVVTNGKKSLEVYATQGDTHTDELLVVYLPAQRILVEADSYSPGPPNAPLPSAVPPNATTL